MSVKTSSLTVGALALATVLAGSPAYAAMAANSNAQDAAFVTAAAQGGMAEVQDAQVAQSRGASSAVKAFAARMITDHTKANEQLTMIAKKDGFALPAGIGAENQQMKSTLGTLSGKTFDTTYLDGQVQGHEKMEQVFKKEIVSGKNPDLVAFAKATLPTVEEHLSIAKRDTGGMSSMN